MLHAGLDLSRRKVDVCLLSSRGEIVDETAVAAGRRWAAWPRGRAAMGRPAVRGVIESMNGARFVHDQLEEHGWEVLIADATRSRGWRRWRARPTRSTPGCWPRCPWRDLVPEIWLPDPEHPPRARARALPAAPGAPSHDAEEPHPRHADRLRSPVPGLRSVRARGPRAARPPRDPRPVAAQRRRQPRADRRSRAADRAAHRRAQATGRRPPLHPAAGHRAGFGWINAFTVASEIGDIDRFASPAKLCGYTGLCPRVNQSGQRPPRPDLKTRPELPALGAVRSRAERLQAPALQRALPAHQATPGPPTRTQGRPDRPLPQAHRGDLAHAHPQPALRSGRRPFSSSRLTALFGHAPPDEPPIQPSPHADGAIET